MQHMTEPLWWGSSMWKRAESGEEAEFLANGISYLACEINGRRYMAPLGSQPPRPDVVIEAVYAAGARQGH